MLAPSLPAAPSAPTTIGTNGHPRAPGPANACFAGQLPPGQNGVRHFGLALFLVRISDFCDTHPLPDQEDFHHAFELSEAFAGNVSSLDLRSGHLLRVLLCHS